MSGPSAAHVAHPRAALLSRALAGVFQPPSPRAANPLSFSPSMKSTESHFTFICGVRLKKANAASREKEKVPELRMEPKVFFFARCYFASPLKGSSVFIHHSEVTRLALISAQAFNVLLVGHR